MLKAEVVDNLIYGCMTWTPLRVYYKKMRRKHRALFHRCSGWLAHTKPCASITFYQKTFEKTGCESIETTDSIVRKRRILLAGFEVRMEKGQLPKYLIMFGEIKRCGRYNYLQHDTEIVDPLGRGRHDELLYHTGRMGWITTAVEQEAEWFASCGRGGITIHEGVELK